MALKEYLMSLVTPCRLYSTLTVWHIHAQNVTTHTVSKGRGLGEHYVYDLLIQQDGFIPFIKLRK